MGELITSRKQPFRGHEHDACDVTAPVPLTLPVDSEVPHRARAFLVQAHCPAHGVRVLDDARLLLSKVLSKVLTNAVRHDPPPISTELECRGSEGMRVRVSATALGAPVVLRGGLEEDGGRGKELVDLLSTQWDVEPGEAGEAVWFQLREDAACVRPDGPPPPRGLTPIPSTCIGAEVARFAGSGR